MNINKGKISDHIEEHGFMYRKPSNSIYTELLKNNISEFQATIIANRLEEEDYKFYKQDIVSYYFNCLRMDHNISKLADIEKASELIMEHIVQGKHIAIVTDYDCDGVNSAAVLYRSLLQIFNVDKNLVSVIINKRRDGNGFNKVLVSRVTKLNTNKKIDLIITADHGSNDNAAYGVFKELGIAMVITDHHQIPNGNPDNCEVFINNQRDDSEYYKDVSGCFIAFLVMVNTYKKMYPNKRLDVFNPVIPYVAISTISDVMSLKLPINRHIVKTGLNEINSFRNKAWFAIKNILNITGKITYKEIGFKIAPLINTANRINAEDLAFKLLSADSSDDVIKYGEELNKLNDFRKTVQKAVIAKEKNIPLNDKYKHSIVLLIDSELSISGIVASNIGESNGLPIVCFLNSPEQDIYTGSGRAIINNLNIEQVFKNIAAEDSSMFIKFGGHKGAAGCSIYKDKLEDFRRLFDKYCKELTPVLLHKDMIHVDMFLPEYKLTPSLIKPIESLGPYGKDWVEPVFLSVLTVSKIFIMGTIAKIIFITPSGRELQGTHFFRTQHDINIKNIRDIIKSGCKTLVSYNVNLDNFRNSLELSFNIVYIKPLED